MPVNNLTIETGALHRYYYFEDQILDEVRRGQSGYLYILPVRRAVRLFKRKLIDAAPARVLIDPPVFTFNDLLLQIYQQTPAARRVLSGDVLPFLIEDILLSHSDKLDYLTSGATVNKGLVKKTTEMLTELRRFGYHYQRFAELTIDEKAARRQKYHNFEILLNELEKRLGDKQIDEPFALCSAAQMADESLFKKIFPEVNKIYISGYGLFTPAMFEFIEKAAGWLPVKIKIEYEKQNDALFRHTAAAIERFEKMGAKFAQMHSSYFSRTLFSRSIGSTSGEDRTEQIEVQPLNDFRDEISYIAARIRDFHLQANIPLHRIAVTFPNLDRYVDDLRRILRDCGLPFNLSTGFRLNQSPLIRAFLAPLRLREANYPFRKTLQLFDSGLIGKAADYNHALLYTLCTEHRTRYLTVKNIERLLDKIQSAKNKKRRPSEENTENFSDAVYQLNQLKTLLSQLYDLPPQADILTYRNRLIAIWREWGLLTWYREENAHLDEQDRENEFRAFNRFMKLFDKMTWMLDFMFGDRMIKLNDYFNYLQTMVDNAIYNLAEKPDYGVQIMPRLEIQASDYEVLFIGGLIDGDFPRASAKDIFFTDPVREEMGLLSAENLLDQDRFLFYTLLDGGAEKIILTYPRYQEERALVPSTFISDLGDVARITYRKDIPDAQRLLNYKKLWKQTAFAIQDLNFDEAGRNLMQLIARADRQNSDNRNEIERVLFRIRHARERMRGQQFSNFEGNLSGIADIENILNQRYGDHEWSVTLLENYAYCPMQFLLEHILGVEALPEYEEEITALERGNIVHKILFRFYNELKAQGQQRQPAAHRELLFRIAENVFQIYEFGGFFWELERSLFFGYGDWPGLLDTFLHYDQEQITGSGFAPHYLEFAFGSVRKPDSDPDSPTGPVTVQADDMSLKLAGKIDRVDCDSEKRTLIFDYKTGRNLPSVRPQDVIEGLHFQLPLYMKVLQEIKTDLQVIGAAYYQVHNVQNCQRKPILADKINWPELPVRGNAPLPNKNVLDEEGNEVTLSRLLDISVRNAVRAVRELQSGIFRHTRFPGDQQCKSYCQFRRICQKNVAKLERGGEAPPPSPPHSPEGE